MISFILSGGGRQSEYRPAHPARPAAAVRAAFARNRPQLKLPKGRSTNS